MRSLSIRNAIENAIIAEELGISFYSELAHKFAFNNELKQTLELLAKDEVMHKRQFSNMLNVLKGDYRASDVDGQYLEDVDISLFFEDMRTIDLNLKPSEILKSALEFEKATVLFYIGIRDIIGSSDELNEIISVEKTHITQINKYILDIRKNRKISDAWF